MIISKWIKEQMEISELNNSTLADAVGVGRSTVSRWLNDGQFPRPAAFKQMLSIFDTEIVEVEFFIDAPLSDKFFLLRCAMGLEIKDLAQGMAYNARLIRKWEKGEQVPNAMQLRRIATYFDVTGEDLGVDVPMESFGVRLQSERVSNNLTQEELGQYLGQSPTTISNYENGKQVPSMSELDKLEEVLQLPIELLILSDDDLPFEEFAVYYLRKQRQLLRDLAKADKELVQS